MRRTIAFFFAALAFLNFTAPFTFAQTNEREQVIMVLDASGSMWGQIDGLSKIEIAREQVANMLEDWDPAIDLGLVAYGHRERGACGDIEIVRQPGPVEADDFMRDFYAIRPLGKTPLSDSVLEAARAMRFSEERATVILLSDGLENCGRDPCALAAELERDGVDFTAHVIGFDLADTDARELSCLAETTGGQFFLAGDAEGLTQSLQQAVAAVVEATPEPEQPPVVVELTPEPEPEPVGPIGLRAQVRLCDTCPFLEDGVFWVILENAVDAAGNRREVTRSAQAVPVFDLAPGEYQLFVRVGRSELMQPVTIEADVLTEAVVTLGSGILRLTAEASAGGQVLEDDLFYVIYDDEVALDGSREEVARSASAKPEFTLPAGTYQAFLRHGSATMTQDVAVLPGDVTQMTMTLNVGYVKVNAVPTAGAAPIGDMFYVVLSDETDLNGNRAEIARSASAETLFKLTEGKYVLFARHGAADVEQDIEVTANALANVTVDMNVGYIGLTTVMAEGLAPLSRDLFYLVNSGTTDLSGNRTEIARSASAEALFRLPAGDYQLVTRHGSALSETNISVAAGTRQDIQIVQDSAVLRPTPLADENGAQVTSGVFWVVLAGEAGLDGSRVEIARSASAIPDLILPAGSYILRARYQNEEFDFPVTVNPGEVLEVSALLKR